MSTPANERPLLPLLNDDRDDFAGPSDDELAEAVRLMTNGKVTAAATDGVEVTRGRLLAELLVLVQASIVTSSPEVQAEVDGTYHGLRQAVFGEGCPGCGEGGCST